jgi:hypothetical protein
VQGSKRYRACGAGISKQASMTGLQTAASSICTAERHSQGYPELKQGALLRLGMAVEGGGMLIHRLSLEL